MNIKKTTALLIGLALASAALLSLPSCSEEEETLICTAHTDADKDKKCDTCQEAFIAECTSHTDTDRNKRCDYCDVEFIIESEWVDYCEYHTDVDRDKKCDYCITDFIDVCNSHTDSDKNKKCDYCDTDFIAECDSHTDSDRDKRCDYCSIDFIGECSKHTDTDRDKKCDYCSLDYIGKCESHTDTDRDKRCDYCSLDYIDKCESHTDTDKDKRCDYCNKSYIGKCESHTDTDKNKKCDYCSASYIGECTSHTDSDKNRKCDYCAADYIGECSDHTDIDKSKKCDYCETDFIGECKRHTDDDNDNACDYCSTYVPSQAVLIRAGKAQFRIVVEDSLPYAFVKKVDELLDELYAIGINTRVVSDMPETITECEVLIGGVATRGEEFMRDQHIYGYEGYSVEVAKEKVLILGGSLESLYTALEAFRTEILGLDKVDSIVGLAMSEEDNITVFDTSHEFTDITISDNSLRDYTIAMRDGDEDELWAATQIRDVIYEKSGIWLEIGAQSAKTHSIVIDLTNKETSISNLGFLAMVSGEDLVIDCRFKNKLEEAFLAILEANNENGNICLDDSFLFEENDYVHVYYKDFGAVGDGVTDDFHAIYETHRYANEWGHTVVAEEGATYYIGTAYQEIMKSIPIRTDVVWTGANFIIDDSVVTVQRYTHVNSNGDDICERCERSFSDVCLALPGSWHSLSLFTVESDYTEYSAYNEFRGKSLSKDATSIGFELGFTALIRIENSEIIHYIRYGVNQNSGAVQSEIILVHPDGTIDPSTPLHWDYEIVTAALVKRVDDIPITIQGGDFVTISNQAANYYDSYGRNIKITRSNVTLRDVKHSLINEGPTRAPYGGFTSTYFANNVRFENMTIQHHKDRYDAASGALLGTYEIGASYSNNLQWINVKQSNFFNEDGSVSYKGLFGTNYCKNFYFDGCNMTSLDAHCGLYNGTVKNSTFEHMNFIGEGLIKLENVTVYADATGCVINLRDDYGSTWNGDIEVSGLTVKYSKNLSLISLCKATYHDWWFGYTTYLPENIYLDNVKLVKYRQTTDSNGNRTETVVSTNAIPLYLYPTAIYNQKKDISKLQSDGGAAKYNPYVGTKYVKVTGCSGLTVKIPTSPQFAELKYERED